MAKQGAMFRLTIIIMMVLTVVIYAVFNSRLLIKGPSVELFDIYNGQRFSGDGFVEIKGKADNISSLKMNGRTIYIDENHIFSEKILLTNTINPIEIYAQDKFGKSTTKSITLIYNNEDEITNVDDLNIAEITESMKKDAAEDLIDTVEEII